MRPPSRGRRCCSGPSIDEGGSIYNAFILADGGRVIGRTLKRELPNYGTFDEKRIFAAGPLPEPIEFQGREARRADLRGHLAGDRSARISPRPAPRSCWCPTAAPTSSTRTTCASGWCARARCRPGLPIAYLNRVGGQDELVFDGSSFVMHPDGELRRADARLGRSAAGHRLGARRPTAGAARRARSHALDRFPGDVYRAMMVGAARLCRRATASPA